MELMKSGDLNKIILCLCAIEKGVEDDDFFQHTKKHGNS